MAGKAECQETGKCTRLDMVVLNRFGILNIRCLECGCSWELEPRPVY